MQHPIQSYLDALHARLGAMTEGRLADYIPELTKVDPNGLGVCLVTMDGVAYSVGDAERPFTIQSISKPFVFGAALADRGQPLVSRKVGVEPSGDAFNSISLDPASGAPKNPMINAGAIATTSLVGGDTPAQQWHRILAALSDFVGRPLDVDEAVYRSESATGFRNRAIAWMLKNFGIIDGDPMAALENYFRQCSVLVSCRDLAYMAATLANNGVNPLTRRRALPAEHVQRVLSVMSTCGMYDYAGSWLYEVGMPAKSGVGGGVIALLQGRLGVAIYSPRLDAKGNSVRGIAACQEISRDFHLHAFNQGGGPHHALLRVYSAADAPSRRQPHPALRELLRAQAHRIKYLSLQGHLAVDGAEYVIRRLQTLAAEDAVHDFILDMHQVEGVSDSAARLLEEARQGFAREGVALVYSRIQGRNGIAGPLSRAARGSGRGYLSFEDNDLAVEWCENRLAGTLESPPEADRLPLASAPLLRQLDAAQLAEIDSLAAVEEHPAGAPLLAAGTPSDGRVFLIEAGRVSVLVPLHGGSHQRIASLGPGMSFGEMALLGQAVRSASVFAETAVRLRVLRVADLDALEARQPAVKIALLENLARDLADKLRGANQWISALA